MKVEQKVGITKPPAVNNLYVFSWNLNKNKFRNLNTKQTTTVTASRAWRKKKHLIGRTIVQRVRFKTLYIS